MRYTIGLREANHNLAKHIKAVESGDEVIITRRGRPVARLTAPVELDRTKDPEWQAAYNRMVRMMENAPKLGGRIQWSRDELYDRGR